MIIVVLLFLAVSVKAFLPARHYLFHTSLQRYKPFVQTPYRDELITNKIKPKPSPIVDPEDIDLEWEGRKEGFDWQLEQARRLLEGPAFAPIRMTLWKPVYQTNSVGSEPTFADNFKILFNNMLQQLGLAKSLDGAPLVQGVNTYRGDFFQFLARILDGNLAELAGGPLFLLLQQYYQKYGPVYKLAFGPKSFIVVSDPVMVRHILKESPLKYDKGILAEILEPIMGKGLIPADPETWKVRRKAIVPGFHKNWLNNMMSLFIECNHPLLRKLDLASQTNSTLNMETEFCSVSLDIIGKAVFNYEFNSVEKVSPVVKAVYRALQEAEHRSTSFIPYWNIPFGEKFFPGLREFSDNMKLLNDILDELITKAFSSPDNAEDFPSLLKFLVDMRGEDMSSNQLRDDLMTMLVAGHETTAAVLTWTFFELTKNKDLYRKVQAEIDSVLTNGRPPTYEDLPSLPYLRLVLAETLRLYPEPPLLIRRALVDDYLPNGHNSKLYEQGLVAGKGDGDGERIFIPKGSDIFISTYNLHRSKWLWKDADQFIPERFLERYTNPLIGGSGAESHGRVAGAGAGGEGKCPFHAEESAPSPPSAAAGGCPFHTTSSSSSSPSSPSLSSSISSPPIPIPIPSIPSPPSPSSSSSGWEGYSPFSLSSKQLYPNEVNADYAFLPFGGGSRKCVGDQFAIMESIVIIAMIMQRYDLELAMPHEAVGMRTGATIHTENGLVMSVKKRTQRQSVE